MNSQSATAPPAATASAYTRTIWAIALAIAAQAIATVIWALALGNAQLLKDGIDWVYDVALYGIAAVVFGRDARAERLAAVGIGAVMAFAGLHTLYDLWDKIVRPRPIEIWTLGFAAVSMVIIAVGIVAALWRFRGEPHPVIRATWLSSRNDLVSTTGFAIVGLTARVMPVRWPEYLFDIVVAGICFQASWAIWRSVRADERRTEPQTASRSGAETA